MKKEFGQVTGIIWRGADDLATYQQLKAYADAHNLKVTEAAKQILTDTLQKK
ncbi:hypothetical protein FD27_GL000873 [Limosilactobacillus frumenti DSM 13145]|uniref:Uncharacterized protein n=1 Tax=Limosilactobacillus frumenti DSM 13145 TaxID=1423746 RepID=A0A0R1PDX2_9LACO|nr:hypothetical protein [Limosilactobacillus frumenti]KRL27123.1 hypothetical protein FD27_GL000873 [Limosilactobacillus frumenti DSM 13145]MBA2913812.1 hypothetical protein [Limosilactobacillus frumenti]